MQKLVVLTMILFLPCLGAYVKAEEYPAQSEDDRPPEWAQPLLLAGVPNLHKVSDDLYRSAQPTCEGMSNLKKLGIETIVNLRSFHSDRARIGNTGLAY